MTADPATIAFYAKTAPHLVYSQADAPSRDLEAFLDRLPVRANILELGCGSGRDAARMVERGFDVDATDGVAAMVRKANERFDLGARVMRFDELDAVGRYDAVWAHACLLHVARAHLPDIISRIHRALRPDGWHYASYKLGEVEGRCLLGRLHNFPAETWVLDRYGDSGFSVEHKSIWGGEGADGTVRDWIAVTAQKLG